MLFLLIPPWHPRSVHLGYFFFFITLLLSLTCPVVTHLSSILYWTLKARTQPYHVMLAHTWQFLEQGKLLRGHRYGARRGLP